MKNTFQNLICELIALYLVAIFYGCKSNSNPVTPVTQNPQIEFNDPIPFNMLGEGIISFERIDSTVSGEGVCLIDASNKTKKVFSGIFDGPAISPDGSKIVFSRLNNWTFAWDIYTMNLDGSKLIDISNLEGNEDYPSWSNDSQNVLFINYNGPRTLYENDSILYTSDPYFDSETPFSLFEGKGMIFSGYIHPGKNPSIDLFNPETKSISTICTTTESGNIFTPRWSPDGNQIAFVQMKWDTASNEYFATGGMVQTYNVLTNELKIIYEWSLDRHTTWAGSNDLSVCWSPDGNKLAFNKIGNGLESHIYLINSDGTGLSQITSEPGAYDRSVSWSK